MDVSIIIVNYKTVPLIINCVHSILEYVRDIEYEVIVVDNHSEDGFQERLRAEFGDGVVCLPLSENIGFGRANNEGFKIAKGRNLFCLNPDTLLLNNAVKILSDYLDGHPGVGACGGNLFDESMRPMHSFSRTFPSFWSELDGLFFNVIGRLAYSDSTMFNHTGTVLDVAYITGADLMMKREVLDITGGFSPDFFMYFEETDLCRRIKNHRLSIVSVPEAKIQHLEGKSFSEQKINVRRMEVFEKGRLIYYRRNVSPVEAVFAHCAYSIGLVLKVIVFGALSICLKRYSFRCKYFFGRLKAAFTLKNIRLWI